MNDLISVIVPIYNVAPYLERCLQSILAQTYSNLEIILVDDGSTDASGNMCDVYAAKESRIRVIHKENGGLSDARNAALDCIKGAYLTFVDGDDFLENDFVAYLYRCIQEADADISICNFKYETESGACINHPQDTGTVRLMEQKEALKNLLYGREVNTSAPMKLYRSALFSNLRYPKGKLYEDIPVTSELFLRAKKCVFGDRALYHYICRVGSITKTVFSENRLDAIIHMREMCKKIQTVYPELESLARACEFSQYVSVYAALKDSKKDKMLETRLYQEMKSINSKNALDKKMRIYSVLARIGKIPFDLCIWVENAVQKRRKMM